jgi:CheY-like chemotaxis protein
MTTPTRKSTVLLVDDDQDYYHLTVDAVKQSGRDWDLRWVQDGAEAMEYLLSQGAFQDRYRHPKPDLILLDLNMPKKNGFETLQEIGLSAELRKIPVAMMTTAHGNDTIKKCYALGAVAFFTKPVNFDRLVDDIRIMDQLIK